MFEYRLNESSALTSYRRTWTGRTGLLGNGLEERTPVQAIFRVRRGAPLAKAW